ncbi:hypothetical protein MHBO_004089 [Bonamia ostreae]|uniref:Uncharacterized protein n=1 Tax=Bonamia ostreae TaxID=126728 RepID=A0ABV2ASX1_9EUKA
MTFEASAINGTVSKNDEENTVQKIKKQLDLKSKHWERLCKNRFAKKRKIGFVQSEKTFMPPEHVRKIVKDHGGF